MLIQETKSGEIGQRCTGQRTEVNGIEARKILQHNDFFPLPNTSMQRLSLKYNVSGDDFTVIWLNACNMFWILPAGFPE